jgi:hypothetical protein
MNNQLKNFIDDLFNQEYTKIQVNKDGLSVINVSLNYHLKIFSDKFNGFYFEFYSREGSIFDAPKISPTYRIENFQEAKSIFDSLIDRIDLSKFYVKKDASKCIELFRKILKKENLPPGYQVEYNNNFIELFDENTNITFKMPKYFLRLANNFLSENQEPTAMFNIHIHTQEGKMINSNQHQEPIIVYIPRYAIKDYPLLNHKPALKNESNLTNSLSTWFEALNNSTAVQQSGASKLVEYYALNENLEQSINIKYRKSKL